jgi:hypothetical protein
MLLGALLIAASITLHLSLIRGNVFKGGLTRDEWKGM